MVSTKRVNLKLWSVERVHSSRYFRDSSCPDNSTITLLLFSSFYCCVRVIDTSCRSEFYTIFNFFSKFGLISTKEWMRLFFIPTNPNCIPANFSTISSILGDISIASFVRLAILMMSLFSLPFFLTERECAIIEK